MTSTHSFTSSWDYGNAYMYMEVFYVKIELFMHCILQPFPSCTLSISLCLKTESKFILFDDWEAFRLVFSSDTRVQKMCLTAELHPQSYPLWMFINSVLTEAHYSWFFIIKDVTPTTHTCIELEQVLINFHPEKLDSFVYLPNHMSKWLLTSLSTLVFHVIFCVLSWRQNVMSYWFPLHFYIYLAVLGIKPGPCIGWAGALDYNSSPLLAFKKSPFLFLF